MKQILIGIYFIFFVTTSTIHCQPKNYIYPNYKLSKDSIEYAQLKTDSLFNSKQIVSIIALSKDYKGKYQVSIVNSGKSLSRTSSLAQGSNALAAINGGFFNMDSGGSVTYFEIKDSVISRTKPLQLKWSKPDSLMNGAIVISKTHDLTIGYAMNGDLYEQSKLEKAVLVTGPLLLNNSKKVNLPNMSIATTRHPRTIIATTNKSILFITIDGRTDEAMGMSLYEVQEFLLMLKVVDAVNLDGGGSTTMWINGIGVYNYPSGNLIERPVANALVIQKK
jgi:exopolysaccharide biosynthesis protein